MVKEISRSLRIKQSSIGLGAFALKETNRCQYPNCIKTFATKYKLQRHVSEVHLGKGKRFECPSCPKVFKRKEHLTRHFHILHLGKRYYCPYCPKSYSEKTNLRTHFINTHKLEACQDCDHYHAPN